MSEKEIRLNHLKMMRARLRDAVDAVKEAHSISVNHEDCAYVTRACCCPVITMNKISDCINTINKEIGELS